MFPESNVAIKSILLRDGMMRFVSRGCYAAILVASVSAYASSNYSYHAAASSSSNFSSSSEGRNCRICDDQKQFFDEMRKQINKTHSNSSKLSSSSSSSSSSSLSKFCAPTAQEFANASWTFLHTVAAHYPDSPSLEERTAAQSLFNSVSTLYPCESCAHHLKDYLKSHPIEEATKGHRELNLWLCRMHNDVNRRLGKPMFPCDKVIERWRDGNDCEDDER